MAARKPDPKEEEDSEDEREVQELFELSTMVSTIDRIVVSLKRLNETVSEGGDLFQAQKDYQDALAGRQKLVETQGKRIKASGEGDEDSDSAYYEDDDEEED